MVTKIWKFLVSLVSDWDPAMYRTQEERALEKAVQDTAAVFNMGFVKQEPVVGVKADIVIKHAGLALCGINGVSTTGIPQRTLARAMETHIRQLTDVEWEFELASSN